MNIAQTGYMATVMPSVVSVSCVLSTSSMDASLRTGRKSVATKDTAPHTRMPTEEMYRGNTSESHPADTRSCDCAAITSAAQVASAKEPNRSEPMPATSPTLSPTLSAMVAGLRGSSSGMPATTFPARSAPTSAALV